MIFTCHNYPDWVASNAPTGAFTDPMFLLAYIVAREPSKKSVSTQTRYSLGNF